MKWRIESTYSGAGHNIDGTFDDAVQAAYERCTTDMSRWVVWLQPANIRIAEVSLRGCIWTKAKLSGQEIVSLMRRYKKTIAGLAFRMGLTQKRVRKVRDKGVDNPYSVRDWLEAISGADPGPLPERYRISSRMEECQCSYCGFPLYIGDRAYEYVSDVFCSVRCCRDSRGWTNNASAQGERNENPAHNPEPASAERQDTSSARSSSPCPEAGA